MWYFTWILGLGLACSFSILNAMWYEFRDKKFIELELNQRSNLNVND